MYSKSKTAWSNISHSDIFYLVFEALKWFQNSEQIKSTYVTCSQMQKFEREMLEAGFFLANYSSIPE